ncbi:hypothetical protein CROQUDRAFT_105800 [Cronartium quercuum f. sp. fusiforme G11]|uniref:Uncharacterized protein n=1 Tax=Cronartium quercuum f. sp. fusiforme G11 TaxID=708437 RepID=A0A9P6NMS6_9BASI|nr:hypothetical protein CROQUDRAFT_105800 [Cronartium quercuum f. sp. fusiforme G11]
MFYFSSLRLFIPQSTTTFIQSSKYYSTITLNKKSSLTRFIYPIILFSLLTSFTINLKSNKLESEDKIHRLNGQISVLEKIHSQLFQKEEKKKKNQQEIKDRVELIKSIENDLKMVGLKPKSNTTTQSMTRKVSWKEVLLGRDGLKEEEEEEVVVVVSRSMLSRPLVLTYMYFRLVCMDFHYLGRAAYGNSQLNGPPFKVTCLVFEQKVSSACLTQAAINFGLKAVLVPSNSIWIRASYLWMVESNPGTTKAASRAIRALI